jgi:glucokinase
MLIAGDIGGTKTDLAIYSIESGPHAPLAQAQFHSADYHSLQAMVSEFLAQVKVPVAYASFDFAGPVIGRFKDLLGRIPVHVITARAALVGAASFGLDSYRHISGVAA